MKTLIISSLTVLLTALPALAQKNHTAMREQRRDQKLAQIQAQNHQIVQALLDKSFTFQPFQMTLPFGMPTNINNATNYLSVSNDNLDINMLFSNVGLNAEPNAGVMRLNAFADQFSYKASQADGQVVVRILADNISNYAYNAVPGQILPSGSSLQPLDLTIRLTFSPSTGQAQLSISTPFVGTVTYLGDVALMD